MQPPAFTAHPWHGVDIGAEAPAIVTAFVELVPSDTVKYEIDKPSGLLKVDRPQRFSNVCPAPYGFVPRTYCAERVAGLCMQQTGRTEITGDGDPLDICILSERLLPRSNILVRAVPIGGLRLVDGGQADDKIIAVLEGDAAYGAWRDIDDCPPGVLERLQHYFLTYKLAPGEMAGGTATPPRRIEIAGVYSRDVAHLVLERSREDYAAHFAGR